MPNTIESKTKYDSITVDPIDNPAVQRFVDKTLERYDGKMPVGQLELELESSRFRNQAKIIYRQSSTLNLWADEAVKIIKAHSYLLDGETVHARHA